MLDRLGELYSQQGRYMEAIFIGFRSLKIREKTLGLDHLDVAKSLDDLVQVYIMVTAYREAEPMAKRSLAIREKALGPDHPIVADT
jgi:hypothetical protein